MAFLQGLIPQLHKPGRMYRSASNLIKRINTSITLLIIVSQIGISQEMMLFTQKDGCRWVLHGCYKDGFPAISLKNNFCFERRVCLGSSNLKLEITLSFPVIQFALWKLYHQTNQITQGTMKHPKLPRRKIWLCQVLSTRSPRGCFCHSAGWCQWPCRGQNCIHFWFSHSFPCPQELLGSIKGFKRQRNDNAFHSEKNKPENGMIFPLLIMCISR